MRHFENATQKPYSYLLLDLKPTTPEQWRLRTDILNKIQSRMRTEGMEQNDIKDGEKSTVSHSSLGDQSKQTYRDETSDYLEDMPSCDDCGILFVNVHDLLRHVKMWCPEQDLKGKETTAKTNQPPNVGFHWTKAVTMTKARASRKNTNISNVWQKRQEKITKMNGTRRKPST